MTPPGWWWRWWRVLTIGTLVGVPVVVVVALAQFSGQPWSKHRLTVTRPVAGFEIVSDSDLACRRHALPPGGAVPCDPGEGLDPDSGTGLRLAVRDLDRGRILRGDDTVVVPAAPDWLVLTVPSGSPAPVPGQPVRVLYSHPDPADGDVTVSGAVDGFALALEGDDAVVIVAPADATTLAPALVPDPMTARAIRAVR